MAGLAQLLECLTAKWDFASSILRARAILRALKYLRNEGTALALQMSRPCMARMAT